MKNIVPLRLKALAFTSIFCAASVNLQAQFISFDNNNVKVVFESVDLENSAGDTVTATLATAVVTETDASGVITSKKQTFAVVSDGSGGTEQLVTQETKTATPDPSTGIFEIVTIEQKKVTPVDETGAATGSTVTATTFDIESDVDEDDLDLPATATFAVVVEELEAPVVISLE